MTVNKAQHRDMHGVHQYCTLAFTFEWVLKRTNKSKGIEHNPTLINGKYTTEEAQKAVIVSKHYKIYANTKRSSMTFVGDLTQMIKPECEHLRKKSNRLYCKLDVTKLTCDIPMFGPFSLTFGTHLPKSRFKLPC